MRQLLSSCLALVLACVFGSGSALAGNPGPIVYSAVGKIKLMNANGTGVVTLTDNTFNGRDPAMSADGKWIAFNGMQIIPGPTPPISGIWVMKAEPQSGTNVPVRVSPLTPNGYRLSWHPGGKWLAYTSTTVGDFEVRMAKVLDAAGTTITPVSGTNPQINVTSSSFRNSYDPAFSPDGKFLAFSDGLAINLLRVFADNGNPLTESLSNQAQVVSRQTPSPAPQTRWPSFNNDGTKIVAAQTQYDSSFENPKTSIAVLTVRNSSGVITPESGANPRQTYTPLIDGLTELMPSWSPDGAFIVFNGSDGVNPPNTLRINADAPASVSNPAVQLTQSADNGGYSAQFAQPGGTLPEPPAPAAVPANIVAWYPGDYAAADIVGAQHALLNNDITYTAGKVGRGWNFDGDADYAVVQDSPALNITGNITVEAWINPTTIGTTNRVIVTKKANNTFQTTFQLAILDDGRLSFYTDGPGGIFNIVSTGTVPTQQFSHVAATMRGSIVTVFLNGAVVGTGNTPVVRHATDGGQMIIGARRTQLTPQNQLDSYFHGVIDELAIYNRALSDAEILGIFKAGDLGKKRDDAARDFIAATNAAGQLWSYGVASIGFVPDPTTFALFSSAFTDGDLAGWDNDGEETPFVVKNTVATASDIFAPEQFSLVPGPHEDGVGSKFAVLRWTAPTAGNYAIGADFSSVRGDPTTASTQYQVWHGAAQLATGSVFGSFSGRPIEHPFGAVREVVAGDVVYFIVGAGQSTGNDETGTFASIVKLPEPEPAFVDPEDLDIEFTGVPMSGKKWKFVVQQDGTREHEGRITLRLQKSSNPSDPNSWTDVPSSTFTLTSSKTWKVELDDEIPVGNFAFRVVTTVAGLGDRFTEASQIYNIAAAAPVLDLTATASAASDPTGATTHRGDLITYTIKVRNTGALPATNLILECFVPRGTTVVKPYTKGAVVSKIRPFPAFPSIISTYCTWKIATMNPSDEFVEYSYTALVVDPAAKDDATSNLVGDILYSFNTLKKADGTLSPTPINKPLQTRIVSPIVVEATADDTTPDQGSDVTFTITVRNKGSITATKAEINALAPDGMFLPVAGDVMQFLDDNGSGGGAPTDPATKTTAKFAKGLNPQRDDSGTQTANHAQMAKFYVGSMLPGDIQKVKVRFRVQYGYYNNLNHGVPTIRAEKLCGFATFGKKLVGQNAPPIDLFVQIKPNHPRPSVSMVMSQLGADEYLKPGATPKDNRRIATVTLKGKAIAGTTPSRFSNEIRYCAVVLNTGNVDADFYTMMLQIPRYTKLKPGTVHMDGVKLPAAKQPSTYVFGDPSDPDATRLINVDVGYIAKNAPYNANSVRKIEFTVFTDSTATVGKVIEQGGGLIVARETFFALGFIFASGASPLQAEVVLPATMDYKGYGAEVTPTTTEVPHFISYRNTGGTAAAGVGIEYHIPPGLSFKEASFVDFEPPTAAILKARGITPPLVGATSGKVIFKIGAVPAAKVVKKKLKPGGGFVKVLLTANPATVKRAATTGDPETRVQDGAYRLDPKFTPYDDTTEKPAAGLRSLASVGGPLISFGDITFGTGYYDSTLAKTWAAMFGPSSILPTEEIIYTVVWANVSDVTAGVGGIQIPIPEGTEYVPGSASMAISTTGEANQNDDAIYRGPGEVAAFPNGAMIWVTNCAPNSAKLASFKVRLKAGTTGKVEAKGGRLGLDQSGCRYLGTVRTHILNPDLPIEQQQVQIYATGVANQTPASMGDPSFNSLYITAARQLTTSSMNISIAGADYVKLENNGVLVIPLGNGRMVAAGGGNLIGMDGSTLVAAGGGNLVAAGGGNLVAAGGGNFISINTGTEVLSGPQFISKIPALVAAGGMNLVAAGAGNLISNDGSTLKGTQPKSLVGNDGASLIGLDGGTIGQFRMTHDGAFFFPQGGGAALSLGLHAANLVAAGGGNLLTAGGGSLLGIGGANLMKADGVYKAAMAGFELDATSADPLVAAGAGNLGPQAGAELVAAGGGNLVNSSTGLLPPP